MHVLILLRPRTQATLSFHVHRRRYHVSVRVVGERPSTGGVEPDLLFHPEGGGLLRLRPVVPITAQPVGHEWTASYAVEPTQLMLLAIYPMERICLEPWTGQAGVYLDDTTVRNGLRIAAKKMLGIHKEESADTKQKQK